MENNVAYMTCDLELLTLTYNFFTMMPVDMCSEYLSYGQDDDYQGECPSNGDYDFSVTYTLPGAGDESTSWLATGWAGSGLFQLFAEEDDSMLIGECTFSLKTYVTPSAEQSYPIPSAAVTAGIVLGALAFVALICCWCYCCTRRRKKTGGSDSDTLSGGSMSTGFKRMDDVGSIKSSKSNKSNKSGNSKSSKNKYGGPNWASPDFKKSTYEPAPQPAQAEESAPPAEEEPAKSSASLVTRLFSSRKAKSDRTIKSAK